MKTLSSKIVGLLVIIVFGLSLGVHSQTCAFRISDPTPSGSYQVTLTLGYMLNGIPYIVGSQTFYNLTPNAVNPISLPWNLPIDTDENIYILRAEAYNNVTIQANNFPAYSQWFNTDFYYNNNNINITVYFN